MALFSELRGRQVISIQEGDRLGDVRDFWIDSAGLSVAAFLLLEEGNERVLKFSDVRKIGPDALMVETAAVAEPRDSNNPPTEWKLFSELSRLQVVSGEGVQLGALADTEFDPMTGRLVSLELRSGGVFGVGAKIEVVPIENVRSFGTGAITLVG
jgi:uncharacterized protein YrrD